MSDPTQLIRRYCKDGDQAAFRAFYRAQADRVWRFLVARGCDPDTAYDLLSEAFLRFFQTVCKDPRAPVALLYRIALNLRIDSYRRAQASPVSFNSELAEAAPEPAAEAMDEHDYVRQLMHTLHADEQNLLLMRYWIGLTHKEIADILGLPEGTVRRQAAAAVRKLRERWEEHL